MRKILSILLALILCLGALVSCGNEESSSSESDQEGVSQSQGEENSSETNSETTPEKEYRSYVFRDVMKVIYGMESDMWKESDEKQIPFENCEKTINGIEYSPTYAIRTVELYNGYVKAVRCSDIDNKALYFIEYGENTSLENSKVISFYDLSIVPTDEAQKTSEIPQIKIAVDFAKEYIKDFYDYDYSSTSFEIDDDCDNCPITYYATKYLFSKKINGHFTTDEVSVTVSNSGKIIAFSIGQIGAFDEVEKTVDFEKVEESVKKELEYECYKLDVDMTAVSPLSSRIIKRDDGRIVLAQAFTITVNKPNEEFLQKSMTIITPLDFEPFEINIEN